MSGHMNCEIFQRNLNAFIDSELDQDLRAEMIAHAKACPACAEQLEVMTRMVTMCAELDEGLVIPLDAQAAWRNAVRAEVKKRGSSRVSALTRSIGALAAALALLVGGTAYYQAQRLSPYPTLYSNQAMVIEDNQAEADYESGGNYGIRPEAAPRVKLQDQTGLIVDGSADNMIPSGANATQTGNNVVEPIVIRTAERNIESTAYDADLRNINDLLEEYECKTEDSSTHGQPLQPGDTQGRRLYMTVRVLTENLDAFLNSLDAVGTSTYRSENARDVSDQYYDVQVRLKTSRELYDRLGELVKSAEEIDDIIALEEKMHDLMAQIDSLEGQIRMWSSQANYSTVRISLTELAPRDVVQPIGDTLGDRARTGFYDSLNWLIRFGQDMAVVLVMALPQLVVVVPVAVLAIVIVRVILRRRRNRKNR